MTVIGGPAKPVHIIESSDLVENGGEYKVTGRVAQRVYGDDSRLIEGDSLQPIYILSDADLVENGGRFKVVGGSASAIPLSKVLTTQKVKGRVAIPVYLENPSWIEKLYFYDSFDDTNGTLLSVHTPDFNLTGNSWVAQQDGGHKITNNTAEGVLAPSLNSISTIDITKANVIITDTITVPFNLRSRGIILRFVNTNNYWLLRIANYTDVEIIQRIGGVNIVRSSSPFVYSAASVVDFTVTADGQNISVIVDDGIITATANYGLATFNQNATVHGIVSSRSGRDFHNDFRVIAW